MRRRLPAVVMGILLPVACLAGESPGLDDPVGRRSYSLGYQIGSDIESKGEKLDPGALELGLRAGLEGADPALSRQQIDTILARVKSMVSARTPKQRTYLAEGRAFLDSNAGKDGVVSLSNGLQYRSVREGKGAIPGAEDRVRIRYRSSVVEGRAFYDSYGKDAPDSVVVGDLIPGMGQALELMHEGARWELFLPPHLAYVTSGPVAYRTVIIDLELVAVERGDPEPIEPEAVGISTSESGES